MMNLTLARYDKKRNVVIPFLLMSEEGDSHDEWMRKSLHNLKAVAEAMDMATELGGLIIETEE